MKAEIHGGATILEPRPNLTPPRSWRRWLIGNPLPTADAPHQTIGKAVGLAVFASDALSSTAYATQEIMVILAAAGTGAFSYVFPISLAIVALMLIVTFSYEQTVHAYPSGGGAYIVARDNLGELPALAAGAALLTDYVLTVAVSVSSGVSQVTSAFPSLYSQRVWIAVALVGLIMLINLRGVKESGITFAIPTYFFVVSMFLTVGIGLLRYFTGSLGMVPNPPVLDLDTLAVVTPFLILHAFSSGTSALTGIEAISNGITAFKEPRSRNAGITLLWMSGILATLFLGISFLSGKIGAIPSERETIISQLARTVFDGTGPLYLAVIAGTSIILILAANTAFADFPRLSAILASDRFLPRQFTFRGSRLVYSRGIVALAGLASGLIILFHASVTRLIPLYAIGVFLSFTLSQAGMAHRWWKSGHVRPGGEKVEAGSVVHYDPKWAMKMIINGFGALCTLVVMFVFAATKFKDGAYIIIVLIPLVVLTFYTIHRHYRRLADKLSLEHFSSPRRITRHRVIVAIAGVHRGSLEALNYARSLSDDVTAIHVSIDPAESQKVREKWSSYGDGIRLVILDSPYRLLVEPIMEYLDNIIAKRQPTEMITVVVPQFVTNHWWENLLHNQSALLLRFALLFKPGVVIVEVPYQI
ncbi:amino acid/polyamine/organocation transporter, APC superfamily [Anaerolinea thermolimosa]|uniref:APC family permease n=1 Tax=Anaerolinea thermolimosa TaxID=229919 RepID=UPI0007822252|nr:APC family permease [Anaerolinea thermolimosa]GAP07830.1 amino acid/polyamine/organocation transporter, APC superfamily [Anaerolinea thermolimosa]